MALDRRADEPRVQAGVAPLLDYAIHYVLLDYAIRSVRRLVNKVPIVLQCVGAKASE